MNDPPRFNLRGFPYSPSSHPQSLSFHQCRWSQLCRSSPGNRSQALSSLQHRSLWAASFLDSSGFPLESRMLNVFIPAKSKQSRSSSPKQNEKLLLHRLPASMIEHEGKTPSELARNSSAFKGF